jgi:uncharacterized protein
MRNDPEVTALISQELRLIRQNVPGVRGAITATRDGLLVGQDVHDLAATQIAALVAALHSVAVQASLLTDCGQLKEVLTRSSHGYLAVYAAGGTSIVAVLGTPELNVGMLNYQARKMIDRIAAHSAGFARQPQAPDVAADGGRSGGAGPGGAGPGGARLGHLDAGSLPARHRNGD